MKPKSTAIWFVLAALLFAFIWFWQKHAASKIVIDTRLLPGLRAADVTSVEIIPAGALEIDAIRTNGDWRLTKPFNYPAQGAVIETLLNGLQTLTPATRLTAAEIDSSKNADADYGFDHPQFSLVISTGNQQWQLRVGKLTAPGDQAFVRVVGVDGVFVTGVNWLQWLPHTVAAWRNTSLVDSTATYDWIVITNGAKVIELRRNATNQLWRLTWPLIARADNDFITAALQELRDAQASRFITDDPKADLTAYGLQPADLSLNFGNGTNLTAGVNTGLATPDNPAEVFAQRSGWNSIVAVTNSVFARWRYTVNYFRDRHLLDLTAPVAEIDVTGKYNFSLQSHSPNVWQVVGEKFPVDAEIVRDYLRKLASLSVADFAKDNNTATDLNNFGLATPPQTEQITLRPTVGDTNNAIASLLFGNVETNGVYVKRADENYVYTIATNDLNALPQFSWQFRNRPIWNFSETNVVQVTLRQNGKTQTLVRTGANSWGVTAGSGIINPLSVEETVHRLGTLSAVGWVGRNITAPADYGFNPDNLSITLELKTGEKFSVDFGAVLPSAQTALAAVTLDGERWAFVFPPTTYQFIVAYLTIPSDAK